MKVRDEGKEHGVKRFGADLRGEEFECGGHDLWIKILAIAGHEGVTGFVDEAHGIKLAGVDCELGMLFGVAHLVHALGKVAAGRHIGEDDIASTGKERRLEGIPLPRFLRNMKFHHKNRSSKFVQRFMDPLRTTAAPYQELSVPFPGWMLVAGMTHVGGWNVVKK